MIVQILLQHQLKMSAFIYKYVCFNVVELLFLVFVNRINVCLNFVTISIENVNCYVHIVCVFDLVV